VLFCTDPIRCIKTPPFSGSYDSIFYERNKPQLFIPSQGYTSSLTREDMGKSSDKHALQIEFFINRKNQIVIIPSMRPNQGGDFFPALGTIEALQVADALEELEVK
jgi:hypothetical protein